MIADAVQVPLPSLHGTADLNIVLGRVVGVVVVMLSSGRAAALCAL